MSGHGHPLETSARSCGRGLCEPFALIIDEAIANTAFGEDVFGVGGVFFDFFAKVVDVQADVVGFVAVFVAPDFDKNLVVGEDEACILHEVIEEAVFRGAEANEFAIHPNAAAVEINLEMFIHLDQGTGARFDRLCPTKNGSDTAYQFPRAEGFGDIIVRTQFETAHPIFLFPFGGEHNHGHVADFPDGLEDVEAVEVGEHDIEQDEVGEGIAQLLYGLLTCDGFHDLKAIMFQIEANEPCHPPLVFHN